VNDRNDTVARRIRQRSGRKAAAYRKALPLQMEIPFAFTSIYAQLLSRLARHHRIANEAPPGRVESIKEQFLILVTCRDEKHQVELLGRSTPEGLTCKALLS
jgi:hypothetical protein